MQVSSVISLLSIIYIIMTQMFTQSNQVLLQLWKKHNETDAQHLQKQKVVEWAREALEKTNSITNIEESMTDLNGLIKEYLTQIHEITQESFHSISLTYKESVQFLQWLTALDNHDPNKAQNNHEKKSQQEAEEMNNEESNEQMKEETLQQNREYIQNILKRQQDKEIANKLNKSISMVQQKQEQMKMDRSQVKKQRQQLKMKTQVDMHINNAENARQDDINENQTSSPNEFSIDFIARKYRDYLKIIFEHYCKSSYATGQDPTFQQIMHKTTVMTINKFMMFAKEFQLTKINPTINRAYIIELFKKNSQFYKEMSCQQFVDAFHKIAAFSFVQGSKNQQNTQNSPLLSAEIIKMLEYCELTTPKKFREKMKKLNIQYRTGPKTNAELKIVPDNYRFKFIANNGKSEEQVRQQINERKINRSERRIFLQEKGNTNQHDLSLNRKRKELKNDVEKKTFNIKQITQTQTQSSNIINKVLTHLVPLPKQKKSSPPQIPKPPTLTPSQENKSNNNNSNIFKKQLGYAQLHKLKASQGYSRKRINSKSNDGLGHYKLNSIVEEARIQVKESQNGNLSESIQTNSRQQTLRMKAYDINKINNKMQQISDKVKKERMIQEELNDLIDIDNDEEDEFLREHLLRQKKNDVVGKRLSNRINELQTRK